MGASGVDFRHRTIAGMACICLGQGRGSSWGLLSGRGAASPGLGAERGAKTATTVRGTVTMWTAATGMAMAATGMVTAAIGFAVAAMGMAKAATGAIPTGTITTGMEANLVPIRGSRDSRHIHSTIRRGLLKVELEILRNS